jgi:hypothetical protein
MGANKKVFFGALFDFHVTAVRESPAPTINIADLIYSQCNAIMDQFKYELPAFHTPSTTSMQATLLATARNS